MRWNACVAVLKNSDYSKGIADLGSAAANRERGILDWTSFRGMLPAPPLQMPAC